MTGVSVNYQFRCLKYRWVIDTMIVFCGVYSDVNRSHAPAGGGVTSSPVLSHCCTLSLSVSPQLFIWQHNENYKTPCVGLFTVNNLMNGGMLVGVLQCSHDDLKCIYNKYYYYISTIKRSIASLFFTRRTRRIKVLSSTVSTEMDLIGSEVVMCGVW